MKSLTLLLSMQHKVISVDKTNTYRARGTLGVRQTGAKR